MSHRSYCPLRKQEKQSFQSITKKYYKCREFAFTANGGAEVQRHRERGLAKLHGGVHGPADDSDNRRDGW